MTRTDLLIHSSSTEAQGGTEGKKFVRQSLCLKGPLPSGLLGIVRGFVTLQPELSSDAIMGRRSFFWTGKIRVVF